MPSLSQPAVVSALVRDVPGTVLGARAAAFRHHRGVVAAVRLVRYGVECPGGRAQLGEQQGAARGSDVGMAGWRSPNQRAVGELLIAPAPKRLDQMMQAAQ